MPRRAFTGLRLARRGAARDAVALMLPTGLDFLCAASAVDVDGRCCPCRSIRRLAPAQLEDHLRRQAGILRNCEARLMITFDACARWRRC